ncbi:MAG: molybdate ABC transporter substrate-binding protein [Acidimicrobiia bacterium]|nr:molybdate ABC transporter substrate-binding protein [Acidimicrobiia bacterium]
MRAMAATLLVMVAGACSGSESELVLGVASSLSEVSADLAEAFGAVSRDGEVQLSVSGSQVLVSQVRGGAPLDVVLTADAATAQTIAALDGWGDPVRVAGNRMVIAVAEGNPLGIQTVSDLANGELTIVLAASEVPAGAYTDELLRRADVRLVPDSNEASVRGVLTKVRLGEADAGIVYQTDLLVGGITGVRIPDAINPTVDYYAVALETGGDQAAEFVEFLLSRDGQSVFANHGFAP